ncbi:SETMR methyltransferase, partial [Acromyrmex charruanus]
MTVHIKQDFGRGRNFNMEQRAVIKFNAKLGKSASETFRSMQQVYGSQCLGRTIVFEWHKRFLEGRETLEDDKKSGRPISVRTPEMIEKVHDFVANDRNASLKMMEEALNNHRHITWHSDLILHEQLGMKKLSARWVPRLLTVDHKRDRMTISKQCLEIFQRNPDEFLRRFITMDEIWIHYFTSETKEHIIHINYLPSKQTINGDYYAALLDHNNILKKTRPHLAKKKVLFHQDNPYAEFRIEDAANFDVSAIALNSPTGYILEVDLEYPQHLHDQLTDLPFCPTRDKPPGKREIKLLATLYDKQHYVIHYRNLQCIRHSPRVTKIHRVVVARTITFDDYTPCLNEEIEMTRRQSCIRSKLHDVYTISESKISLSPYDDKRYVSDSTETLP